MAVVSTVEAQIRVSPPDRASTMDKTDSRMETRPKAVMLKEELATTPF